MGDEMQLHSFLDRWEMEVSFTFQPIYPRKKL